MKKLILTTITSLTILAGAFAQCVPGSDYPSANFADSLFGAWPDTTVGFPDADQGVYYSQNLTFKVPLDGGDVDPLYAGVGIDSFWVDTVIGLPPCLSYSTNNPNGSYLGGELGCIEIFGTCNTTGSYDVTIKTLGWATLVVAFSVPYDFVGYHIDVIGTTGEIEITKQDFYVTQNSPNPFRGNTEIVYQTKETGNILFDVYDLLGKKVYSEIYQSTFGQNVITFNSGNTPAGVYMYTLSQGDKVITKKINIAGE